MDTKYKVTKVFGKKSLKSMQLFVYELWSWMIGEVRYLQDLYSPHNSACKYVKRFSLIDVYLKQRQYFGQKQAISRGLDLGSIFGILSRKILYSCFVFLKFCANCFFTVLCWFFVSMNLKARVTYWAMWSRLPAMIKTTSYFNDL